jgi:hypothetical protein
LEQQGVADSASAARNYLVGGGKRSAEGSDLTYLKNAMGNEIAFSVEKGGGARANLLATRTRRRRKLMDAAATRVGASVPLDLRLKEQEKRKLEEEQKAKLEKNGDKKQKCSGPGTTPLVFLNNNIGRQGLDREMERLRQRDMEQDQDYDDGWDEDEYNEAHIIVLDETEEMPHLWEEETRKVAFQAQYSKEMTRQVQLLHIDADTSAALASPPKMSSVDEDRSVAWEDA